MALNENQILNLLNDGYDSDIDIPEEDEDQENELEILLQNFENDDLFGYLETIREEEEQLQAIEVAQEDTDEAQEIQSPVLAPITFEYILVQKKDIEWIAKPCQVPNLKLDDLITINHPITIPTPIDYFMTYFNNEFYENVAYYTNLCAVQKTGFILNQQMQLR